MDSCDCCGLGGDYYLDPLEKHLLLLRSYLNFLHWCYLDIHLLDSHTRECDIADGFVFHDNCSDAILWMLDPVTSSEVGGRVLLP